MSERNFKSRNVRVLFLGLAAVGLAHFSMSVFAWLIVILPGLKHGGVDWAYFFRHSAPAFVLFAAFAVATLLAWKSRILAVPIVIVSLIAAAICFQYDSTHHFYQLQAMEPGKACTHSYCTWWWYDDSRDPQR